MNEYDAGFFSAREWAQEEIEELENEIASLRAAIAAQQDGAGIREAAKAVCWFDWSGNDSDAVAAIDRLRRALEQSPS